MFRLVAKRRAWWPVLFAGVTEEGVVVENKVELRFIILDDDEIAAFYQRLEAVNQPVEVAGEPVEGEAAIPATIPGSAERVTPVLAEIIDDWRGVADENGVAVPFSLPAFTAFLKVPLVGAAVGSAYHHCRMATPEIRAGN